MTDPDLNEGARPAAPDFAALPALTHRQTMPGEHLAQIHAMHLAETAQIEGLLAQIADGSAPPEALEPAVEALELTRNLKMFGALCGRKCSGLFFHHDAEELHVFPILEAAAKAEGLPELTAVVAKLRAEHEVIHALLDDLLASARALYDDPAPSRLPEAGRAFAALAGAIRSHFRYEEEVIGEAIGRFDAL